LAEIEARGDRSTTESVHLDIGCVAEWSVPMTGYFGEREGYPIPLDRDVIDTEYWGGFVAVVNRLTGDGSLTESYPEHCPDGGIFGCDRGHLGAAIRAEVRGLGWPLQGGEPPSTVSALDAAEFFYRRVSTPGRRDYHAFPRHEHSAEFDRGRGRAMYQEAVNTLLRRAGLPFEMQNGRVGRAGPPVLTNALASVVWRTSDPELDEMLKSAHEKFGSKDPAVRREALEELWDAFERVKTSESRDKREGVTRALDETTSEPKFRAFLETEAKALTALGNDLMIRHKETDKAPIERESHVDYLFLRMFAFLWLVLSSTGRAHMRR
jgi:hypothetical protein